jgi:hypothetical protein
MLILYHIIVWIHESKGQNYLCAMNHISPMHVNHCLEHNIISFHCSALYNVYRESNKVPDGLAIYLIIWLWSSPTPL